ncbi:pentatricopeptide repeat-containing protein At2g13600-like [Cryptomeria japonica]|uniref:pentatricopeptide repeat-containing protein At2g13600-like n=1 Tax=Cryptomeria japonica TaxID=3369 RepID=UPI0027DA3F3C|nr:pentatricopeptide repeat-containing protein At2g13600-like [Cryptomeria japonica]
MLAFTRKPLQRVSKSTFTSMTGDTHLPSGTFLQNTLINMYDKCGSLLDVRKVFDRMPEPDVFSWNVTITAYKSQGYFREAFTLFHQMQRTDIQPDHFTFSTILPVCASTASLKDSTQIHGKAIICGFQSNIIVMNALIAMYAKCGCIADSSKLFDKMAQRDVVSWSAIVAGYAQNGLVQEAVEIFRQMQSEGVNPNSVTLASVLPAFTKMGALEQGMEIHQKIMESRLLSNVVVMTALIDMYAKCGTIDKARELFDKMPQRNVVSWTAIIVGYVQNGLVEKASQLFKQMRLVGVKPNRATFATIIPACAKMGALDLGMEIHQGIIESGFLSNIVTVNALIDMYGKCGRVQMAQKLLDKVPEHDVVSWNTMIVGYAQNGYVDKALEIFKRMQSVHLKPNSTTFASILPACAKLGALEEGMEIHQKIIKNGFLSDTVVVNALIGMYAKCETMQKACDLFDKLDNADVVSWNVMITGYAQNGVLDEALKLFNEMPHRNMVSWTAILSGCTQHGFADKALQNFKQMQLAGVKPHAASFASILPACAKIGALEQGMEIHHKVIESGFLADTVANSLIDMYAKCGSIQKARELFNKIPQRNVVSWNAMIAGYAVHGYSKDALELFESMKTSGTDPDRVSLVCVLFACSHAGLVDEGCKYFSAMSDSYCVMPTIDHHICMVDLLGRAGHLEETFNFIIKMPIQPDAVVWMCLLDTCRSHKNIMLGEFVAIILFELNPKNAAPYVLLSNMYAEVGRWGDRQKIRKSMEDGGIKKIPGCSWIEVNKAVHIFCVRDISNPQTQEIYEKLEKLS